MKRFDLLAGLIALILMIGMSYVTYDILSGPSSDEPIAHAPSRSAHVTGVPQSASSPSSSIPSGSSHTSSTVWDSLPHSAPAKPMLIAATSGTGPVPTPEDSPIPSDDHPSDSRPSLDEIHFHFDRAGFSDRAKATLDHHAEVLLKEPTWSVLIQGHTDQEGSIESNLRVGRRRAESVRQYLIDKGVPAERLHIVSLGEFALACAEDTPECRERNRRVSFALAPRAIPLSTPQEPATGEGAEETVPDSEAALSSEEVAEDVIASSDSLPASGIPVSLDTAAPAAPFTAGTPANSATPDPTVPAELQSEPHPDGERDSSAQAAASDGLDDTQAPNP